MKLTDGLFGTWNGGGVMLDRLDLDLKAGAQNDTAASVSYGALFVEHPSFQFDWIESEKTTMTWGYSKTNRGAIRGSRMMAAREGDAWRLEFKGGTFRQNWLRGLEISKLVVICDQKGVHIQEAKLLSGEGSLTFQLDMGSGGQPEASGTLVLDSLPVKTILPYLYSEWIEGEVSGKGRVSGSTNSQKGVVLDLDFALQDGDVLILRDRLPFISALSVMDVYNSYRKILFTEGGFHLRTGEDQLHLDQIHLKAGDLFQLTGKIDVRLPTLKEIANSLKIEDVQVVKDIIEKNWKMEDEVLNDADSGASLSYAAKGVGDVVVDDTNNQKDVKLDMRSRSVLAERKIRRFDGSVKVGLKGDAFDHSPKLKEAYPKDPATGRIWIEVPLKGSLQTLTLDQAKKLYVLGRKLK
jgi:hypothetical protein